MIDNRRITGIRRAAGVITKLAGLVTVSMLAGGCSMLPFWPKSSAKVERSLRPEIHEVSTNPEPDCLAADAPPHQTTSIHPAPMTEAPAAESPQCTACGCGSAKAGHVLDAPIELSALGATPAPGEAELQRLMDGNKRFVEGEAKNVYHRAQRPGEATRRRPPAAMVLACSDWEILPEAAFDARAGELYVVRVGGNVADEAVIASAKHAVQRYNIPLIVVLGHEGCGTIEAMAEPSGEGRTASAKLAAPRREASSSANGAAQLAAAASINPVDRAVHANIDETVADLVRSDLVITSRIAAGRLKIIGACYNPGNGQITLHPDPSPSPGLAATPLE